MTHGRSQSALVERRPYEYQFTPVRMENCLLQFKFLEPEKWLSGEPEVAHRFEYC